MSRIVHSGGIDRESDAKMAFDTNEKVQVMSTFDSLGLKEDLLRGIYAYSKEMFYTDFYNFCGRFDF